MNKPRQLHLTRKRDSLAHHMLLSAAFYALEKAEAKKHECFYEVLAAITFSAFAIEAMGNAFGDRIVPDWKEFESASPCAKLRLIAEHLEVPYENKKEPWETLWWLSKFRNRIAHPKPEMLTESRRIDEAEYEMHRFDAPKSKLEREITIPNARRAVEALQNIECKFLEKLDSEHHSSLFADGWSGSTKLHNKT